MSDQQFGQLADRLLRLFWDQPWQRDRCQTSGPLDRSLDRSSTAAGNPAGSTQRAPHTAD